MTSGTSRSVSELGFGERLHHGIERARDDDIMPLFKIDGAGLISSSVATNEAHAVGIDGKDITFGRFKFDIAVHELFAPDPD